jgi:4-amino-4-deoxy-L-arabinose transferase-like glycosyltransferase
VPGPSAWDAYDNIRVREATKNTAVETRRSIAPGLSFILPAVITLSALGLRFYKLGSKSLWLDEIITAEVSCKGIGNIVRFSITDTGPLPLAYVFEYLTQLFGRSEFLVRLPSALFGIATIPVLYLLGKRLFDSLRIGAIAAVLLTFSAFHHYYSQEARGYALYVLLAVLSLWFLEWALEKHRLKSWILYGLCCVLLVYTTYFGVFIVLANLIYGPLLTLRAGGGVTIGTTRKSNMMALILVTVAVGLVLLPWVVLNYPVHKAYGTGREPYSLLQMADYLYSTMLHFSNHWGTSAQRGSEEAILRLRYADSFPSGCSDLPDPGRPFSFVPLPDSSAPFHIAAGCSRTGMDWQLYCPYSPGI